MRKELIGIFLFFLVVFTLISLLSYNPSDPSINNAKAAGEVHNLFGVVGSNIAGIFVGLFGMASFFIPATILFVSIRFFGDYTRRIILFTLAGGFLLTIATGSLLSFHENGFDIFGHEFSSGGIIGISLKSFLVKYSNITGSVIILVVMWITGFILATGFSVISILKRLDGNDLICFRTDIDALHQVERTEG